MKYDIMDNYFFWDELAKCLNKQYTLLERRGKLLLLLDRLNSVNSGNIKNKQIFISIVKDFVYKYEIKILFNNDKLSNYMQK